MPPIIVLFELKPTPEGRARYLDLAAMLKPLLSGFEGFVRAERFESLADHSKLLSMNVWTDEAAVSRWRNTLKHRLRALSERGRNLFRAALGAHDRKKIRVIRIKKGIRLRYYRIPSLTDL